MKIIEIGEACTTLGGISKSILKLHQEFLSAGHDSFVFCPKQAPYGNRKIYSGYSKLEFLTNVIFEIRKMNPDIIHIHNSFPAPALFLSPVVFTLWDPLLPDESIMSKFIYRVILKRCKKLVLVTEWEKKRYEHYKKSEIIPAGFDPKIYHSHGKKKKLGLSIVSITGPGGKRGNVPILIRVFNELKPEFPDLSLWFVGPCSTENQAIWLHKSAYLEDVHFVGPVTDEKELAEYYRGCTIYASGSLYEGFGMPFIEANACGKAVVAFKRAAIPFVVKHGRTGLLADNYAEFKQNVRVLLRDSTLRKKLEVNALRMSEEYTWKKIAYKYLDLFEEVCENKNTDK